MPHRPFADVFRRGSPISTARSSNAPRSAPIPMEARNRCSARSRRTTSKSPRSCPGGAARSPSVFGPRDVQAGQCLLRTLPRRPYHDIVSLARVPVRGSLRGMTISSKPVSRLALPARGHRACRLVLPLLQSEPARCERKPGSWHRHIIAERR